MRRGRHGDLPTDATGELDALVGGLVARLVDASIDAAEAEVVATLGRLRSRVRNVAPVGAPLERRLADEHGLTRRESELLVAMVDGVPRAGLADHFGVGEATVKTHLKHLRKKLGSPRLNDAVWALRVEHGRVGAGALSYARRRRSP